jgi:hypothetical protein
MVVNMGGKEGFPDTEGHIYLQANPSYVGSGSANTSGDQHLCSHHLRHDIAALQQWTLSPCCFLLQISDQCRTQLQYTQPQDVCDHPSIGRLAPLPQRPTRNLEDLDQSRKPAVLDQGTKPHLVPGQMGTIAQQVPLHTHT